VSEESDAPEWLDKEVDRHLDDAWRCYLKDQCIEGERLSRAAIAMDPFRGDGWYVLAVCMERQRKTANADRNFQRAATATTNPQQAPYRVSWKRFERSVERAADAIPNFLRRALEEVTLVLRNYAAPEVIDPEKEGETLSIHLGPTRDQVDQSSAMSLPEPAIHMYRRPHEHLSSSGSEFDTRMLISLVHGLGTFLGYNEDRIAEMINHLITE
jgi:predicted Zn-dependent protease with MMP-like domain